MLADISHDLKTPMTTIQGYARAITDGLVKDDHKKQIYLKTIYEKSQRVVMLIDELFNYSRLEQSDYVMVRKKEDINECLRKIVAEHYGEIEDNKFVLQMQLPEKVVWVEIDTKQISRAISNILSNALKYNPEGTKLRVTLYEEDNEVLIEIGDNGVGIPPLLQQSIFEPFVRGDTARRSDGGTGLGLSIARNKE